MKRLWLDLPAYFRIMALWPQAAFAYRVDFGFRVVQILLKIFLLKVIWTAVYAGREVVDGVPLQDLIAFLTLAQLQVWVMSPHIAEYIQDRVREGKIALDLARPVPFMGQMFAHQLGGTVSYLPFVLLAIPFALVMGGFVLPASVAIGVVYLFSLALGYLISVLLGMALGLLRFWTAQANGITMIYTFINQFFTGALVPLWFFPLWLRQVAAVLPFQAQTFTPLSIYLGRVPAQDIPFLLGVQVLWVVLLFATVGLMWQAALRRVVIQGG